MKLKISGDNCGQSLSYWLGLTWLVGFTGNYDLASKSFVHYDSVCSYIQDSVWFDGHNRRCIVSHYFGEKLRGERRSSRAGELKGDKWWLG